MIKLREELIKSLLGQPESGMGYQEVEFAYKLGGSRRGTVLNADLLIEERESLEKFAGLRYEDLLGQAGAEPYVIDWMHLVPWADTRVRSPLVKTGEAKERGPAAEAGTEDSHENDVFKRFSAYANDRRITAQRGLLPGTYATTEQDARLVSTGVEAVERYALPNPTPATNVFTIGPSAKTPLKRGIVQPAFGHMGGGVEVVFIRGTGHNTVTGPTTIPER